MRWPWTQDPPRKAAKPAGLEAQRFGEPTSTAPGGDGEVWSLNKVTRNLLLGLYRENPLYRKGVNKAAGDLVREWVTLRDPKTGKEHGDNDDFQAWCKQQSIPGKARTGVVAAHIYGDGPVELVWNDSGKSNDEAPLTAELEDIQVLDSRHCNLRVVKDKATDAFRVGAVLQFPGKTRTLLHPSRFHHLKVFEVPGEIPGLSSAEAAYHVGLSMVQSDQALGEIVKHHGPGFKHARVLDDDQKTIDEIRETFKSPKMLRGIATSKNVEMQNFGASGLDVESYYDAYYVGVAAAIGMPVDILKGVQAGDVSGSQTNRAEWQADLTQTRATVLDPLIGRLVAGFTGLGPDQVIHEWNPYPELSTESAATFRERAAGVAQLALAGVPLKLALRESGIDIEDAELLQVAPPANGMLPPEAALTPQR